MGRSDADRTWPGTGCHWSLDEGSWIRPEDSQSRNAGGPGERNPFIAFKRFVDRSFSSIFCGSRSQAQTTRQHDPLLDAELNWSGDASRGGDQTRNQPLIPRDLASVFFTQLTMLAMEGYKGKLLPQESIGRLFSSGEDDASGQKIGGDDTISEAMLAFGGACYFSPDVGDRLPIAASSLFRRQPSGGVQPRWLSLEWFKRSPYSPVCLEVSENEKTRAQDWRGAFEDLIEAYWAEHAVPCHPLGPLMLPVLPDRAYPLCGRDWALSLLWRRLLPYFATFQQRGSAWEINVDETDVERFVDECQESRALKSAQWIEKGLLDPAYPTLDDAIANLRGPRKTGAVGYRAGQSSHAAGPLSGANEGKATIVSTDCTTETTRMPDGTTTVVTITVNKFSDGSETRSQSSDYTRNVPE